MEFKALELSLSAIRSLRHPVGAIARRDPKLADQIRRASASVALNLSEGRRRMGKDRTQHWRIASGSADEVRTALRVSEAWGYLKRADIQVALSTLDQVLAILWRLTR